MSEYISQNIAQSIGVKKSLKTQTTNILNASKLASNCLKSGGKIILFGNGGSAADAQHIAAEFVGKFAIKRKGYHALALTTNSSIVTAVGNDYGFEKIFERQLEAIFSKNDLVIAISTSGNSKNVLEGIKFAKKQRLLSIGMTGKNGGKLASMVDLAIKVPSENTQRIQECHILIGHIIVGLVEQLLSKKIL